MGLVGSVGGYQVEKRRFSISKLVEVSIINSFKKKKKITVSLIYMTNATVGH